MLKGCIIKPPSGFLPCHRLENHDGPCAMPADPAFALPEPILQFFAFGHLSEELKAISRPFAELAGRIIEACPRNAERTTALRKLLEAKDCAVRAKLFKEP